MVSILYTILRTERRPSCYLFNPGCIEMGTISKSMLTVNWGLQILALVCVKWWMSLLRAIPWLFSPVFCCHKGVGTACKTWDCLNSSCLSSTFSMLCRMSFFQVNGEKIPFYATVHSEYWILSSDEQTCWCIFAVFLILVKDMSGFKGWYAGFRSKVDD